jgi:endonuclease/exonuclease/phosphatase family metal-dependent hydrolase
MMVLTRLLMLVVLPLSAVLPNLVQKNNPSPKISSKRSAEDDSTLLESGPPSKLKQVGLSNGELKIVSYNIRYRSGDDLNELMKLLREDPEIGNALVLGLQEVDRNKSRTKKTNTARIISEGLGFNYAWAAPPTAKSVDEEETGVAIMSPFPISDIRRIVLPHQGPNQRRRVALGATVRIAGTDVRVYSMHGETRLATDKKIEQMNAVLENLRQYPTTMPAIIVGDFNTWEAGVEKKTIKLFSDAGLHTPFGSQSTFKARALFIPLEFRLDWVWLRGLDVLTYGIDKKIGLSDHFPLWTNVKLRSEKSTAIQHP